MAYEPVLDGLPATNVYGEHVYKIRITYGAAGAISSFRSKDATVAKTGGGDGEYTVTLPTVYNEITDFNIDFQDASGAVLFGVIKSETIQTDGKVVLEVRTEAGTATNPTSGDKAFIRIGVSRDLLNDKFTG